MTKIKSEFEKTVAYRFKTVRHFKDLSQAEMSTILGVHVQSVSRYERGEIVPSEQTLRLLSEKLNINLSWLKTGEGEMLKSTPISQRPAFGNIGEPAAMVPVYGNIPAGWPAEKDESEVIDTVLMPEVPYGAIVLKIKVDDMFPRIRPGSLAVVVPVLDENKLRNGEVVAVNDELGKTHCREFYRKGEQILLKPLSQQDPTFILDENYRIMGKVLGSWAFTEA